MFKDVHSLKTSEHPMVSCRTGNDIFSPRPITSGVFCRAWKPLRCLQGRKERGRAVLVSPGTMGARMASLAHMLRVQLITSSGVRKEFLPPGRIGTGPWGFSPSSAALSTAPCQGPRGHFWPVGPCCCRTRSPAACVISPPLFPVAALFF